MARACHSDNSFGPTVIGSCRGGFDFTLVFEDSMLGLLPQAALLLLGPIRLATLRRRRDRIIKHSHLGFLKTVTGIFYTASSVVLLAIWSEIHSFKTKLSIASASLEFLGSLLIVTLSQLEHRRAVRPSHLLQFFLLVLFLCDAVRLRTLFLMDYPTSLVTPASIHTLLTGFLLLLESLDKRELFNSEGDRRLPPEETVGLFGKRLFWYLNALFKEGYRKILKPADLYTMDGDLASRDHADLFQRTWEAQDKSKPVPLLRTIFRVLWWDSLLPIIPRTIQIATTLSQPYLISMMIKYVQERDIPGSENKGYGLIAAFALNYTMLAIASSWCAQSMTRFLTKLRACLISALFDQTLHMTSSDVDLSAATVLMNVDVDKLLNGAKQINEIWAALVSTAISLYILYTHLGVAFVAPFLTILISTGIITLLGSSMKARQLLYGAATQKRVTTTSYIAGNMKGVRMLGLSQTVLHMLTQLREAEVAASIYIRKILLWVLVVSNVMFQLTTVATYVTFAVMMLLKGQRNILDFNRLYGSLSALKLVGSPLMVVLQLIPTLQLCLSSLERIENFLKKGSVQKEEPNLRLSEEGVELLSLHGHGKHYGALLMKDASFAIDNKSLLFNLNLQCENGTFIMVIGKVGSGKSVFLRSIVGETDLCSGTFKPSLSGTAYCDQQVWLRNLSVRENIVGEAPFDESWYKRVLWSCGLFQDLREMKEGDHTLIGSKGISLSGGQKNRLSLARAIYARKPILVIDDMLAGLDNATEKLVFSRVFGRDGLARTSRTTVILATHATHYARFSDQIIVMSDGRIIQQGTYQELVAKNVDFHKYASNEDTSTKDSDPSVTDETDTVLEDSFEFLNPETHDSEEDDASRQAGDRKSLFFFMKAVGYMHITIHFITLSAAIGLTQIQYFWLKWWAESHDRSKSGTIRQIYLFIIVTLVNVLAFLVTYGHFLMWFMPKVSLNLHARQLVALMRAKFSILASMDVGSITNIFSQDIMLVDMQLLSSWANVTFEGLNLICIVVIMVIATPPAAATIPLLAGVGYGIQRVYLRTSRQVRLMDLEAKAPLCTHFIETLAGIATVRAFGWTSLYRKKNDLLLEQSQIPFYLLAGIQNWLTLVLELVVAGLITLIVGLAVGLRSKIDPGYLGLALVSAMDLGFDFRIIILYWTELETSLSAVTRIRQFAATPPEDETSCPISPPESWPKNGSVDFKNFCASYSNGGKLVIKDVNLNIKPGEKIGLCGRTGSGKSSLIATLFGLLSVQQGGIFIDDVPIKDIALSLLRSKIIALPQEPLFLKGTVRYNLNPWTAKDHHSAISDEQMAEVLKEVKLWDKLKSAAEGSQSALDLSLDNVENLLSQGERQLFCLARSILMDGKIVVLDEATSSVDTQTDALMQKILRTAFADRTIIAIAHRLDTILDFDRVVVMDAGKIAEIGEPGVLMKTNGSLFRELVETQGKH